MRNLISGIVGTLLGGLILLGFLLRGGVQGEGSYLAGQVGGLACGAVFLLAGLFYLYLGVTGLGEDRGGPVRRKSARRSRMGPRVPRRQPSAPYEEADEAGLEEEAAYEGGAARRPGAVSAPRKNPWLLPALIGGAAAVLLCGLGGIIGIVLLVVGGLRSHSVPPPGGGFGVPSRDPGKPVSVVLSNASVTPHQIGVNVTVDYRVEVPSNSPFDQFHLVLKTAEGKTYDMWLPELNANQQGRVKQWFAQVPREQAGPFEIYVELQRGGPGQKEIVSNRLKVGAR